MRLGVITGGALAACVALTAAASVAVADTYEVTRKGDPDLGVCEPNDCSLREAIDAANAHPGPDRVLLPQAGIYQLRQIGPDEDNRHGDLDVLDGELRVLHPGGGRAAVDFDPPDDQFGPLDRIFEVHSGASLRLRKVVVTDGGDPTGTADGGGILAHGDLTLTRSAVRGNTAPGYGGGIAAHPEVTLTLLRSAVRGNQAGIDGGGVMQITPAGPIDGHLFIFRSRISNNAAVGGDGGGLLFRNGENEESAIRESTFSGNTAGDDGAGFYAEAGPLRVTGTTVSGNDAVDDGGGIVVGGPTQFAIENSTIAGNTAEGLGGGIYASSTVEANSITVARNIADADADNVGKRAVLFTGGGGLFAQGSDFQVTNSIVALNIRGTGEADDCSGASFASGGYNLLSTNDGCSGFGQTGDIEKANPRLGELRNNGGPTRTIALEDGSVAIGAANPVTAPDLDQRRVERRNPDIGAFERR